MLRVKLIMHEAFASGNDLGGQDSLLTVKSVFLFVTQQSYNLYCRGIDFSTQSLFNGFMVILRLSKSLNSNVEKAGLFISNKSIRK